MRDLARDVEGIYDELEGSELVESYHARHSTPSACILTVTDEGRARRITRRIQPRIQGKAVIELGAGVGILACTMAEHATSVIAIEVDPAWSWAFIRHLYRKKPENLTWIFGDAREIATWLRGDVAVIATHSGRGAMLEIAKTMCQEIVEVYPT